MNTDIRTRQGCEQQQTNAYKPKRPNGLHSANKRLLHVSNHETGTPIRMAIQLTHCCSDLLKDVRVVISRPLMGRVNYVDNRDRVAAGANGQPEHLVCAALVPSMCRGPLVEYVASIPNDSAVSNIMRKERW